MKKIETSGKNLLCIPNTPEGHKFYQQFKKFKNPIFHTVRRGRGTRKNGLGKQDHIKLVNSEWWALYVNEYDDMRYLRDRNHHLELTNNNLGHQIDRLLREKKVLEIDLEAERDQYALLGSEMDDLEEDYEALKSDYEHLKLTWWRRVARRFYYAIWWLANHKLSIQIREV